MYKISIQSYSKKNKDIFIVEDINTIRTSSGLSLKISEFDKESKTKKEYFIFKDYKGQYNPYLGNITINEVTCTDEIKEKFEYDSNVISSINIEYLGGNY